MRKRRIDEQRDQEIVELRQQGWRLHEIGKQFGISRQRVLQILKRADYVPDVPLVRKGRATKISGYSRSQLDRFVAQGQLAPVRWVREPWGEYVLFRKDDLERLPERRCDFCGEPLGKGKARFCKRQCRVDWWNRYKSWPEERKALYRELCR